MQTQITEVVQCMYGLHKYMLFKHTNHYIDLIHVVCSYTSYHKNIYINPTWHIVFIPPPPKFQFHQTWRVRTSTNTCRLRCFSQHWLITDVQQWCWGCLPWWPLWKITTIGITYIHFCRILAGMRPKTNKMIYDDFKSRSHSNRNQKPHLFLQNWTNTASSIGTLECPVQMVNPMSQRCKGSRLHEG